MGKTVEYFKPWMHDSITYKGVVSNDGAQIIFASDGVEITECYIVGDITLITDNKGKEVVSNQQIYLDGINSDVVTIIDDNGSGIIVINDRNRKIQKINAMKDEDGNYDLVVVYL